VKTSLETTLISTSYDAFPYPSCDDIQALMDYSRNGEVNVRSHIDIGSFHNDMKNENKMFHAIALPPNDKDLVELLRA